MDGDNFFSNYIQTNYLTHTWQQRQKFIAFYKVTFDFWYLKFIVVEIERETVASVRAGTIDSGT